MRALVAGWVGSTNLGDELVLAGLRRHLAARGLEITAISVDPDATRRAHGVAAVGAGARSVAGALRRADLVILGGGGLLQDETSPFNLPYHLARVWPAALRRTPWAGVGLGAGPLHRRWSRALVRATLARAVAVSVRDEPSAALLAGTGCRRPAVAADLAFALPPPATPPGDSLVVSLRGWSHRTTWRPAGTRVHQLPAPVVDDLARELDAVAARTGLQVQFVALQRDRDEAVHHAVAAQMHHEVQFSTPDLESFLPTIATARLVVAMRYHAVVASVLAGRPVVALDYSPKVGALASELGAGARRLPWDDVGGELADAGAAVLGRDEVIHDARDRLTARERRNGEVLDRLLDAT